MYHVLFFRTWASRTWSIFKAIIYREGLIKFDSTKDFPSECMGMALNPPKNEEYDEVTEVAKGGCIRFSHRFRVLT